MQKVLKALILFSKKKKTSVIKCYFYILNRFISQGYIGSGFPERDDDKVFSNVLIVNFMLTFEPRQKNEIKHSIK